LGWRAPIRTGDIAVLHRCPGGLDRYLVVVRLGGRFRRFNRDGFGDRGFVRLGGRRGDGIDKTSPTRRAKFRPLARGGAANRAVRHGGAPPCPGGRVRAAIPRAVLLLAVRIESVRDVTDRQTPSPWPR